MDGLEILRDGRFFATRARGVGEFYEVNPRANVETGLAELTLVPLSLDPAIVGNLNGLESFPPRRQLQTILVGLLRLAEEHDLSRHKTFRLALPLLIADAALRRGRTEFAARLLDRFGVRLSKLVERGNIDADDAQPLLDAAALLNEELTG